MLRALTICWIHHARVVLIPLCFWAEFNPHQLFLVGVKLFLFCVSFAQLIQVLILRHLDGAPRGLWGASSVSSNISEHPVF
jgi:hypothetical protein